MGKSDEIIVLAKARSKKKGIPFAAALSEIGREQPGLIHSAREEVTGRKLEMCTSGVSGNSLNITAHEIGQRLSEMVHSRSEEKHISFSEALSEIGRENSDLIRRAREEVLAQKF